MEKSDTIDEDLSRYRNVSGMDIVLRKKYIGKSDCIQYTIEKDCQSLSWKHFLLTTCIALFALSLHLSSLLAICIFATLSIILLYDLVWEIEKEVLLVTVAVGIQFTSMFKSGQQRSCLIPWHCVKDVYIVEAISLHRVLYNLVILTECQKHEKTSEKLIPLFQGTKPRLRCLENIYRSIHNILPQINSFCCKGIT